MTNTTTLDIRVDGLPEDAQSGPVRAAVEQAIAQAGQSIAEALAPSRNSRVERDPATETESKPPAERQQPAEQKSTPKEGSTPTVTVEGEAKTTIDPKGQPSTTIGAKVVVKFPWP